MLMPYWLFLLEKSNDPKEQQAREGLTKLLCKLSSNTRQELESKVNDGVNCRKCTNYRVLQEVTPCIL